MGKILGWTVVLLLPLVFMVVALLPIILPRLPTFEYALDLSPKLSEFQRRQFHDTWVRVRWQFVADEDHDVAVRAKGSMLGLPVSLRLTADYSLWRLSASAAASGGFDRTPWQLQGEFAGSVADGWVASAQLPPVCFDEQDPLLRSLVAAMPMSGISDLGFSGQLALSANAATTNGLSVPTWSATAELSEGALKYVHDRTPVAVDKFQVRLGADGIGSHVDVRPAMPRIASLTFGGFSLTNVHAALRVDERVILVTEAGAQTLGGDLHLYSLVLNPRNLNAKVTIFLDNIDSESAMRCMGGFKGHASGRLHGKLPLRLRHGASIILEDGYLYSIPGETGEIQFADPAQMIDTLAAAGVTPDVRSNLDKVLQNLAYSALTMNLKSNSSREYELAFKLQGSATRGETTVPVEFEINLHGNLEQLINTGLQASKKRKKP